MSSSSGLLQTSVVSPGQQSPESNVATLYGSFQGNGSSAPAAAQFRGNWFSAVTRVAAGHYRVQVNLKVPVNVVAINTTGVGNGNPNGLLAEAEAWPVGDVVGTAPDLCQCYTAKYDSVTTNFNTFDIFIYEPTSSSVTTPAAFDPTTATRICFRLAWKQNAATP